MVKGGIKRVSLNDPQYRAGSRALRSDTKTVKKFVRDTSCDSIFLRSIDLYTRFYSHSDFNSLKAYADV